jgi:RND family efflux transporter MFP subunit
LVRDSSRRTVVLVLLLCAAACDGPKRASADRPVAPVETQTRADQVQASGIVKPQVGAEVRVGPRISGTLVRLHARVGQHVEAGSVLAELENSELQSALSQAHAGRDEAEVAYKLAQETFNRLKSLSKNGVVSQESLREAELGVMRAAAAVKQSRAAEETARIQLSYATVRAPTSGTVASVSTQTGETVSASLASPTFVTIIDLNRLQIIAYVDEVDIGLVHLGQPATFTADAVPEKEFHGTVTAINPAAHVRDNVVSFEVVTSIADDTEQRLRPEMSVSVTIATGQPHTVLLVPSDAIERDAGGHTVVEVLSASGELHKRPVQAGREEGDRTEIRSGLAPGERVLRNTRDKKVER